MTHFSHLLTNDCSDVFALCDVMDALQRAAHSLHRDASTAAAATLAETIRQGCKDVQSRAVFLAQVHAPRARVTRRRLLFHLNPPITSNARIMLTRARSVTLLRT